jgi:esterase/lipase superfamily enzyme
MVNSIDRRMARWAGLVALLWLCGCTSQAEILPLMPIATEHADLEPIMVATTRALDNDPDVLFSGARAAHLGLADITVSVPRDREPGEIRYPSKTPDLAEDFAAVSVTTGLEKEEFVERINDRLARAPKGERSVVLFVHGYNTDFAESLYRLAQMRRDFRFGGVAVAYTWPSAGKAPLYLYDRDSAGFARSGFVETLRLVTGSQAESVLLIGHSMGALVTMEGLREISLRGEKHLIHRLGGLVLASPDIDVDLFETQLAALETRPDPFVIIVSGRDRALTVSNRLRGGHARLGQGTIIKKLQDDGIVVIDLTDINDGDRINHSTFASSPTLIKLFESGALGRDKFLAREEGPANPLGEGIGQLSDLAANIIYLPANIAGVR